MQHKVSHTVSSVVTQSCPALFVTPWTAACQGSLSVTNSRSWLKLTSFESGMPSKHLVLCHPLLLLPSIFLSIRVFSSESALHIRWPRYWSFSIRPSNAYSGLESPSDPTPSEEDERRHQFFSAQLSLWSRSHIHASRQ